LGQGPNPEIAVADAVRALFVRTAPVPKPAICYCGWMSKTNAPPELHAAATQRQVLRRVFASRNRGESAALVVITALEGRTSRSVGTVMAVGQSGWVSGSISGGCFDAAVIAEAHAALGDGRVRQLRLGAGSPWIDIKLPCGGGLDLLICPDPDPEILDEALAAIAARKAHHIALDKGDGTIFDLHMLVPLRLLVAGNGGEVVALSHLGHAMDADVMALSPEATLLASLGPGIDCLHLKTPDALDGLVFDSRTAVAVFFHDHDWEPPLLARALASDAFFVGAMGSLQTHQARRAALLALGLDEAAIARIASPIGLFGPVREPHALAVSALAQILTLQPPA
jgi:xanthine dehydrogenase accessory factor